MSRATSEPEPGYVFADPRGRRRASLIALAFVLCVLLAGFIYVAGTGLMGSPSPGH